MEDDVLGHPVLASKQKYLKLEFRTNTSKNSKEFDDLR